MTIAEIHGKISHTGSNLSNQLEDLLTSDVFAACRYVRPELLLLPFLRGAKTVDGISLATFLDAPIERAYYRFWSWLAACEPDVLIALEDSSRRFCLVLVEAKYFSAKSSSALDGEELELASAPSDQLAREYLALLDPAGSFHLPDHFLREHVCCHTLVYVTAHRSMPRLAMQESIDEIAHFLPNHTRVNLFWATWFDLQRILARANPMEYERPILDDLRQLLVKKRLVRFAGFDAVGHVDGVAAGSVYAGASLVTTGHCTFQVARETPMESPVFYSSSRRVSNYDWHLPPAPTVISFYVRCAT